MANPTWDQTEPLQAQTQAQPSESPTWEGTESLDDKFGTPGQQVLAGVEGLAKGLAGPLATGAERVLHESGVPGLSPEEQTGRAEANPWTHGLSEAAGFIAPAVASFGASAAGRAALEAPEAISMGANALGKFSQSGVLNQIGEAAAKASGLGFEGAGTVSKIAASGIRTGAEMAALQAGDEISKQINQDPGASLGQAAVNIGLSGIIGGAGGAVLGAVSPLWKASMEKIGAPKLIDDAKAQYNFRQGLQNGGDVPAAIADELGTRLSETQAIRSQMENLKGGSLARAMPEVTPENSAKIDAQIQEIASDMAHHIEKASDNAYLKGSVPKLSQDLQDFMQVVTDPAAGYAEKFDAINALKRAQQAKSNYRLNAEDTALGDFTKGLAADIRLKLEDAKVWGDAAKVQRDVNAAIKKSIDAADIAVGKFTSKTMDGLAADKDKIATLVNQNLKGKGVSKSSAIKDYIEHTDKLAETINRIHEEAGLEAPIRMTPTPALDHTIGRSSPGTTLGNWLYDKGLASVAGHVGAEGLGAGLGSLVGHPVLGAAIGEKLLAPTITSIAKPLLESASRSDALKGSMEYVTNVIKGEKLLNTGIENVFKLGAEVVPAHLLPNVASRDRLEKSLDYASNADNALKIGGNVGHYMPSHATTAASTAATAVNYLKSLKPVQPQQSPLDKPAPIDKARQYQYDRALNIAQQPLLALQYAKEGTLQAQDVKTLNTIYPDLHSKMVGKIYNDMVKTISEGKAIPYKQRVSLSLLMGKPLDSTMTMQSMQAIMAANALKPGKQPQQGGIPKATSTSMQKVNSMYQTPSQARASDRLKG